jgi:hypothetical protein
MTLAGWFSRLWFYSTSAKKRRAIAALWRATETFQQNSEYAIRKAQDYTRQAGVQPRNSRRQETYLKVALQFERIAEQAGGHADLMICVIDSLDTLHVQAEVARALQISADILETRENTESWGAVDCINELLEVTQIAACPTPEPDAPQVVREALPDIPSGAPAIATTGQQNRRLQNVTA